MTALQKLFQELVKAVAISANAIFDKSFETKSFDGKAWKQRKRDRRGSLLINSGALRRSIRYTINGNQITWTSNLPYAKIHNDGGFIKITPKMRRFFWHMYYTCTKKIKRGKKGQVLKASKVHSEDAEFWKAMALLATRKQGAYIKIPRRRFIGNSNEVSRKIKQITDAFMKRLDDAIARQSKARARS
ncbi:MAG: phage virion morphogenesis protein [Bacteroidales bacterium]|jgi:phage gpG-like protein|nr:phage virion morphogenesis protein [Bacteroidales bacterium]MBO7462509.1 phage virion morphogenesis protein [Bacteroidales bacterium]MBO7566622.1 phage virion morphogenesis protein [Bacteroidales bacterium]